MAPEPCAPLTPREIASYHALTGRCCLVVSHHKNIAEKFMIDVLYIAGTLLFFALMFAYVAACAALGEPSNAEEKS